MSWQPARPRWVRPASAALLVTALTAPLVVGVAPTAGAVLFAGALVVLATVARPGAAVVGCVVATPLLVGLGRGSVVPGLRLNEALLAPVLLGVGLLLLRRWWAGGGRLPRHLHPLDVAVAAAALTSSVTPLLWMYARERDISTDDLLHAVALWKLAGLYLLVRVGARSPRWRARTLVAVVAVALVVGVVGLLQALGQEAVLDLLARWVPEEEGGYSQSINRATATIGNPISFGDLMVYAAVVAAALGLRLRRRRTVLWAAAGFLCLCAAASGQFSGLLGLAVAGVAFGAATGTLRRVALAGVALGAVAAVALRPVIAARVAAFEPGSGLPVSWVGPYGRLSNLQRFFWPEIAADGNWLFGVQPASRVAGPEPWREWVYIESGYTWAVWTGGVPLLLSVVALVVLALRTGRRLGALEAPVDAALGVAVTCAGWVLAVLLLLDPHLTLRAAADVLFVLLALAANADATRAAPPDAVADAPGDPGPSDLLRHDADDLVGAAR